MDAKKDDKNNSGKEMKNLHPLLPHIAGVIDDLKEATFSVILGHVRCDVDGHTTENELVQGLKNGLNLGLFTTRQDLKCYDLRGAEGNIEKNVGNKLKEAPKKESSSVDLQGEDLVKFIKKQRTQRKKNTSRAKKYYVGKGLPFRNKYMSNKKISNYLCHRCKKSLEKLFDDTFHSGSAIKRSSGCSGGSSRSMHTRKLSTNKIKHQEQNGKTAKEKSKLLVEKNPMETEPPYFDIFT